MISLMGRLPFAQFFGTAINAFSTIGEREIVSAPALPELHALAMDTRVRA